MKQEILGLFITLNQRKFILAGENDSIIVLYDDSSGEIIDIAANRTCTEWKSLSNLPIVATKISPNKEKLCIAYIAGQFQIYNLKNNALDYAQDAMQESIHATHFFDDNNLIIVRADRTRLNIKGKLLIQLWNLTLGTRIAYCTQYERHGCNSIDVDSQKQFLLLGMRGLDLALQKFTSFKFTTDILDPEKICTNPAFLNTLLEKKQLNFDDKFALITNYAKDTRSL